MHWELAQTPIEYQDAVRHMEDYVEMLMRAQVPEKIWLLEHPPIYTAGSSAKVSDLIKPKFPVFESGRGGQYTYHGPGQRVAYVMIDLNKRQRDVRSYVCALEQWIIDTLALLGIEAGRRSGRIGIWVPMNNGEAKIAAVGIRLRRWVSFHGIALNVNPDLSHYEGIVPCGIREHGVTSLYQLGIQTTLENVDHALKAAWKKNLFLNPSIPNSL